MAQLFTGKHGPQATFAPRQFEAAIDFHGLVYRWSRAVECGCRLNAQTDQWDPTCRHCGGDGWRYVNPNAQRERHLTVDYVEVKAIFSSISNHPDAQRDFGPFDFGEATLTVPAGITLGYRDRFIGVEQEMAYNQLLRRGTDPYVPVGRAGLSTALQATAMRYEPIRVNFLEADDGAGGKVPYFDGVDFVIVPGSGPTPARLRWLEGRGPAPGTLYTVHYDVRPVWIVDQAIFRVQQSKGPPEGLKGAPVKQNLPTTFKVKLDYLTDHRG